MKIKSRSILFMFILAVFVVVGGQGCQKSIKDSSSVGVEEDGKEGGSTTVEGKNDKPGDGGSEKDDKDGIGHLEFKYYTGTYQLRLSGFTGILQIVYDKGAYSGTIQFTNWGNNLPEPLKDLKIRDRKIYFIRSITTEEEKILFGSSRLFKQTYHGIFSDDGSMIRGSYVDSGTEYKWEARR